MKVSTYTVGALLRRDFRRDLLRQGLQFTEDKGWLDSLFVVTAPYNWHANTHRVCRRIEQG